MIKPISEYVWCLNFTHCWQVAEDEDVDVEGEECSYEEYTWAGQTRIRATTMLDGGSLAGTS